MFILDFVCIVLWSVDLPAGFLDGSPCRDILGSGCLPFALRLGAVAHIVPDLPPGKGERGGPEYLFESSLFLFDLVPVELDPLAPLADFGPAADVLGGDPQPRGLAGLSDPCFDLAEYLVDQRHGYLAVVGGTRGSLVVAGAFLPFGFLHEFLWIPFRI